MGVWHPRSVLPELSAWVVAIHFPAERVTTTLADFDDAPLPGRLPPPTWTHFGATAALIVDGRASVQGDLYATPRMV